MNPTDVAVMKKEAGFLVKPGMTRKAVSCPGQARNDKEVIYWLVAFLLVSGIIFRWLVAFVGFEGQFWAGGLKSSVNHAPSVLSLSANILCFLDSA